jgi:MFS family permease
MALAARLWPDGLDLPNAGDPRVPSPPKTVSMTLLVVSQMCAMSLWFTAAAIMPDMIREGALDSFTQALMTSMVQAGFVTGALIISISGLADRYDPRLIVAACALGAAVANAVLLTASIGGSGAIAARFATGALLAGVYPVGMKIAAGWGLRDRGTLVGILVGALTFGSAASYFAAFLGETDWRSVVVVTSLIGGAGGLLVLGSGLGPHHAHAPRFTPAAILLIVTERRIRLPFLGYLGHMWELYAMWSWAAAIASASYAASLGAAQAVQLGKLTAALAIALGGLACVPAGMFADRIGKAEVTIVAMVASGLGALLTAASFGGPVWLTFALILVWGIAIVPDSAQFSALIADASPPHLAGSLLTFQTAIGFALTVFTVQVTPVAAAWIGWPLLLCILAIGPAFGVAAMWGMRRAAK